MLFKFLPSELSGELVSPYFSQFRCGVTKFFPFGAFARPLCGGYSITSGYPLLPRTPRLCQPGPHAGARARHSLPFKGYFSTWHLPRAGEPNKLPLVSVFTLTPSILIPGRSISPWSQRTHYTPFICTQPQSYVCPQEETFPMQRMTQTRSEQR